MHFKDSQQDRERRVTAALAWGGALHDSLVRAIGIKGMYWMTTEFDKSKYGRRGDVDIVFVTNPGKRGEAIYAVEVKVMYLRPEGQFQSEKKEKHHKQIALLEQEGWHRVFLLDVIVTAPASTWWHPQAFEGFDKFGKSVKSANAGHIVMQVNSVAHKPETDAGAVSVKVIKPSRFVRASSPLRCVIRRALAAERCHRA